MMPTHPHMVPPEPPEAVDVPAIGTLPASLSGFQRDILTEIIRLSVHSGAPPHGTPIKNRLTAAYGREIHTGRLYPNLNDLADMDILDIHAQNGRTNAYVISSEGRRILRESLLAQLSALPPGDIEALLDELGIVVEIDRVEID